MPPRLSSISLGNALILFMGRDSRRHDADHVKPELFLHRTGNRKVSLVDRIKCPTEDTDFHVLSPFDRFTATLYHLTKDFSTIIIIPFDNSLYSTVP